MCMFLNLNTGYVHFYAYVSTSCQRIIDQQALLVISRNLYQHNHICQMHKTTGWNQKY